MPKFSIKDLMISTAMVAAGLAIAMYGYRSWNPYEELPRDLPLFIVGVTLVGAGFLYPFADKKALVALIAFFCLVAAFIYSLPRVQ